MWLLGKSTTMIQLYVTIFFTSIVYFKIIWLLQPMRLLHFYNSRDCKYYVKTSTFLRLFQRFFWKMKPYRFFANQKTHAYVANSVSKLKAIANAMHLLLLFEKTTNANANCICICHWKTTNVNAICICNCICICCCFCHWKTTYKDAASKTF